MEKSSKIVVIIGIILLLAIPIALAAPNQITLQGKLTNAAGAAIASTKVNATFRIYDSFENGTQLWIQETNITTDANGIYDIILRNLNLTFADQYYLGMTLGSDLEATPRINLTTTPYSFRANISEDLNQNNSYVVRNLSVTANVTLGSGELSTLKINTLYLNLTTADLNFSGGIGIGGASSYFTNKLGIGIIIPASKLDVIGDVSISGPLNASSLNVTGNAYFATASGNVGIGTTATSSKLDVLGGIKATGLINLTNNTAFNQTLFVTNGNVGIGIAEPSHKLVVVGSVNITNGLNVSNGLTVKSGNVAIGAESPNVTLHVSGRANITGYLEVGQGLNVSNGVNVLSGNVGVGITEPNYLLQIAAGTDGRSVNLSNVLYINASNIRAGIGTTSPTEALDINGNLKLSSATPLINVSGPIIRKSGNDIVISD